MYFYLLVLYPLPVVNPILCPMDRKRAVVLIMAIDLDWIDLRTKYSPSPIKTGMDMRLSVYGLTTISISYLLLDSYLYPMNNK